MRQLTFLSFLVLIALPPVARADQSLWHAGPVPESVVAIAEESVRGVMGAEVYAQYVDRCGGGPANTIEDYYWVLFAHSPLGTDHTLQFSVTVTGTGRWHQWHGAENTNNVPDCSENPSWCEVVVGPSDAVELARAVGCFSEGDRLEADLAIGGSHHVGYRLVWRVAADKSVTGHSQFEGHVDIGADDGSVLGVIRTIYR